MEWPMPGLFPGVVGRNWSTPCSSLLMLLFFTEPTAVVLKPPELLCTLKVVFLFLIGFLWVPKCLASVGRISWHTIMLIIRRTMQKFKNTAFAIADDGFMLITNAKKYTRTISLSVSLGFKGWFQVSLSLYKKHINSS